MQAALKGTAASVTAAKRSHSRKQPAEGCSIVSKRTSWPNDERQSGSIARRWGSCQLGHSLAQQSKPDSHKQVHCTQAGCSTRTSAPLCFPRGSQLSSPTAVSTCPTGRMLSRSRTPNARWPASTPVAAVNRLFSAGWNRSSAAAAGLTQLSMFSPACKMSSHRNRLWCLQQQQT